MFLNEAQVCLTGYVATQPTTKTVKSGATTVSMRVAWTPRKQDRVSGEWVDGNTSYVTVICWRKLATNTAICVRKGDPVIVKGRLSIRNYEDKQGAQRIAVEVEANSVGHDLSRGVAQFQRVRPQTGLTASEFAAANGGQPQADGGGGSVPSSSGDEDAGGPNNFLLPEPSDAEDPFFDEPAGDAGRAADVAEDPEKVAAPF
jgi:single-strand DNA-binding protein